MVTRHRFTLTKSWAPDSCGSVRYALRVYSKLRRENAPFACAGGTAYDPVTPAAAAITAAVVILPRDCPIAGMISSRSQGQGWRGRYFRESG
jgi:hypothetical protein